MTEVYDAVAGGGRDVTRVTNALRDNVTVTVTLSQAVVIFTAVQPGVDSLQVKHAHRTDAPDAHAVQADLSLRLIVVNTPNTLQYTVNMQYTSTSLCFEGLRH